MEQQTIQRNYGIDALRMLAMFMVVILHILGRGGVLAAGEPLSPQYETAWFLEIAAYCAVNCYAVISGYVGGQSKYRYTSIAMLWLRVVFYTVLITLFYQIMWPACITSKRMWIKAIFPVLFSQYWYFTAYFGLFFLIPVLNAAEEKFSHKQFTALVVGLTLVFSVGPRIFWDDCFETSNGYSPWWLLILYLVGVYIRKYGLFEKWNKWIWLGVYGVSVTVTWLSKYGLEGILQRDGNWMVNYTAPTILLASMALLQLFKKIRFSPFLQKVIAVCSPLSFSVYLIHVHPLVWDNVMEARFADYAGYAPFKLVLAVLGTAIAIYVVCSLADVLREKLFRMLGAKKKLSELEKKYIGPIW